MSAGTERTRVAAAAVFRGMTSKQRFHARNGKSSRFLNTPSTAGTCIAGEVVAQCGRRGILVRLAGRSAGRNQAAFWRGIESLGRYLAGDSCPTDTRQDKPPRLPLGLLLCADRGWTRSSRDQWPACCLCRQPLHRQLSVDRRVSAKAKEPRGWRAKQANDSMH
jgi:hypothetical protein